MRREGDFSTLDKGRLADLLVLTEDPRNDVRAFRSALDTALPDDVADVARKVAGFDVDDVKDAVDDAGKGVKREVRKVDSRDVIRPCTTSSRRWRPCHWPTAT